VIGLSLVTVGIYAIWLHYRMNEDARLFLRDDSIRPGVSVLAITLGWFVIVPPFISIYRTGERVERMELQAGVRDTISPALFLVIWIFVSFLIEAWAVEHVNRALDASAGGAGVAPTGSLPPPPA
jgi:hypothetical protein